MSRVVLMSIEDLKNPHYGSVVDIPALKEQLFNQPSFLGEWGSYVPLEPMYYRLAGEGDQTSIDKIITLCNINRHSACVQYNDVTFNEQEGVVAYVEPSGPERERYVKNKDKVQFIPRYWFDIKGRLRIKTWDVSWK